MIIIVSSSPLSLARARAASGVFLAHHCFSSPSHSYLFFFFFFSPCQDRSSIFFRSALPHSLLSHHIGRLISQNMSTRDERRPECVRIQSRRSSSTHACVQRRTLNFILSPALHDERGKEYVQTSRRESDFFFFFSLFVLFVMFNRNERR